jgi:hypothetical protein
MSASKKYGVRMPAARVGVCISAAGLNMPSNAAVSTFLRLLRAGGTKKPGGKEHGGKDSKEDGGEHSKDGEQATGEGVGQPPIEHGRTLGSG